MNPTEIKAELERLNEERRKTFRGSWGGDSFKEVSYLDADNIHGNHQRTATEIFRDYQALTDQMNALRLELKGYVDRLDNLTDKVLFLVNVYGMTQKTAAEYLGYSYGYIRRVFMNAENR